MGYRKRNLQYDEGEIRSIENMMHRSSSASDFRCRLEKFVSRRGRDISRLRGINGKERLVVKLALSGKSQEEIEERTELSNKPIRNFLERIGVLDYWTKLREQARKENSREYRGLKRAAQSDEPPSLRKLTKYQGPNTPEGVKKYLISEGIYQDYLKRRGKKT
ncbi:hypothetical protein CMI45_02735 [Candidatus Pacearchaeota archaeon]|nr:hypothetical protein [Candidatus Pacearchaeota archaeon]|tara:strand:- start:3551 stop:4039 length:489 start_codon:yes stop_codon:yes gene_type:complete